jgi:flagellum-specific peptidoglycan hydrolase FlgJ
VTQKQKDFINLIKPGAILAYVKYKVLPSLTLAQGILESAWGESILATQAYNFFGIKWQDGCGYNYVIKPTQEYSNNKWITIDGYFRKYKSIEEGIKDHGKFLTKSRYAKVLTAKDYIEATNEIWKAGYATDPNYSSKLQSYIKKYKLYEVDNMVKTWEYELGCKAIDELYQKGLIDSPDSWKIKDLKNELTPLWLFFEMYRRLAEK